MQILTRQMEQIGRLCAEDFLDRLTAFVRATPGARGEAVTREAIAALAERASSHGFTFQSTIATFVITAHLLGDDFDRRFPAAGAILAGPLPEELRAYALEHLTVTLLSPPPPDEA